MSKTLENAIALTKRTIRIVWVKTSQSESLPEGGIDFLELIAINAIDFNSLKAYGSPQDIALLPYSR